MCLNLGHTNLYCEFSSIVQILFGWFSLAHISNPIQLWIVTTPFHPTKGFMAQKFSYISGRFQAALRHV